MVQVLSPALFFRGETVAFRKIVDFPSCGFSAKKRQISRKTVHFPGCGFSAKKRQFSRKTVHFPSCGFSAEKRRISGKTVHFPSCGFSAEKTTYYRKKRWILRGKTTFPVKIHRIKPKAGYSSKIHVFLRFFTVMPIMTPTAAMMNATATEAATTEPGLEKNAVFSTGGLGRSDSLSAEESTLMVMTCE